MEHTISIKIADYDYKFKITSEEEEAIYRNAAERTNKIISSYKDKYPSKTKDEILTLVSFAESIEALKKVSHIENINTEAKELNQSLQDYIERNIK